MFKKIIEVQSIDVDEFGTLKLSALFKYIQLIAGEAIEVAGIGQQVLLDKGYAWVLTRIAVQINRWPKWQEKITFATYPNDNRKFIYPRHFIIYDKDNNELVRIVSTWALIDVIKRSITIYDLSEFKDFKTEKHDNELALPSKLFVSEDNTYLYSHTVRYTDCDINHHLNNTRYIDLILDTHESSFYKNNEITYFQIQYELEAREKDIIDIFYNDNQVIGKINNKTTFVSYMEYKER